MQFENSLLVRILKFVIPAGLLSYLFFLVFKDWSMAYGYFQEINISYLLIALPFFLIIYPEGAFCWFVVLKYLKIKVPLSRVLSVWIISNTSRYIPGTVWQYLSRVFLSEKILKISKTDAAASTILEIFFVLSGSVIVSFFSLSILGDFDTSKLYLLFSLIILIILFYSQISKYALIFLNKIAKKNINIERFALSLLDSIKIVIFFILNFVLNGLALYLLILAFGIQFPVNYVFTISGFYAVSWLIGYISFFSPGGLGVTEVSLTYFLSLLIPLELSPIIAVFYRLFLTLAELVVFLVFLNRKEFKKKIFKYER
ncbi:MAG: hypothetical protein ACD_31C00005G0058 [uncultured bacterium]|uniref:Lysylphosphatidylglycerol synthetase/UPF0104 n=3 Tax=Candidatus Daviesiibacteriota TaxID=1752718 RepID=A0A0G0EUN0_9BACT|nr:MAG: hypothetical protein ACD_31C00005G0058 [uncultured bacterium]KKQ10633.1 MAG: hypothetical protein US19_C0002G0052 [Candidatus Daviesbacteria bacterium GW2011_GWB1_36_5]KKQ15106.1 MAG: hypothetical protein US28_C0023G0007 [Candidatus Daviesbacteria bacterium GW2011_GWA1_36_8]OGE17819.1 MAG: hypothetical protein A2858_03690 [Candidatus Daviesbacteria bacterium RIFCSPHIGHO2_01_FULL_36_37]